MLSRHARRIAVLGIGIAASPVFAQSSVTLYGLIDQSIVYQSSAGTLGSTSGGHSAVKMISGIWAGSRFGLQGKEDLGGGLKAIFLLESNFNGSNGQAQFTNAMFGYQSYMGLSHPDYGQLTFGRQYTPYYLLLSPYGPGPWLTGFWGAKAGDIDEMSSGYRANNAIQYQSPVWYGFTISGSFSLAGVPGSVNQGSTWAGAIRYANGPVGIAAGITRINNATPGGGPFSPNSTTYSAAQIGVSAVTNGYQTAQAQQRIAVTGKYAFTPALDISFTASNVQYIPGINSAYRDLAIWNSASMMVHWKVVPTLDLAAGYSFTKATRANGITSSAQYQQFNLGQYYSLSKRTGIYAMEAYQRAGGRVLGTNGAGNIINATATIGGAFNSSPSSSRSQFGASIGIIQLF